MRRSWIAADDGGRRGRCRLERDDQIVKPGGLVESGPSPSFADRERFVRFLDLHRFTPR